MSATILPTRSNKPIRVVSYIRMSSDKQEDSPERQRTGINSLASAKRYTILKEYLDAGISGWKENRPDFKQMMADAAAGQFDLILVDEFSRLSRQSPLEFMAKVAYPLQSAGVSVEAAASGPLDWDNLVGQILTVVKADKASEEVRNMSRRVLGGMVREAKTAAWNSPAPFGYKVVRETDPGDPRKVISRRLELDNPLHVEAVKWIFAEYASGRRGLASIVSELQKRGIVSKTRKGKKTEAVLQPFTPQGIATILRNPVYVGDHVWNRVNTGKFSKLVNGVAELQSKIKRGKTAESEWIVVENAHPAIIDRDTFQAVKERLKTNRRRTTPLQDGGGFKLSKLLVCGKCGGWMSGFTSNRDEKKKYRCGNYYQHGRKACDSNTVNESPLVRAIATHLQRALVNPDTISTLRAEVARQEAEMIDPSTRKGLAQRLATLDDRIRLGEARLLELPSDVVSGAVDALRKMKTERATVADEIAKIDAQSKPTEDLEQAVNEIANRLWRLREVMEKGAPADVRSTLESLIDRVVVNFDRTEYGKIVRTKLRGGVICIKPPTGVSNLVTVAGNT